MRYLIMVKGSLNWNLIINSETISDAIIKYRDHFLIVESLSEKEFMKIFQPEIIILDNIEEI